MKILLKNVISAMIGALCFSSAPSESSKNEYNCTTHLNVTAVSTTGSHTDNTTGTEQYNDSQPMQLLPLPSSDLEETRKSNMVYVDKTSFLLPLRDMWGGLFLYTRPRRFGKTFFVSTIKRYFKGEEELFTGTFIHEHGNCKKKTWVKYPVIHLDLSKIQFLDFLHQPKDMVYQVFKREIEGALQLDFPSQFVPQIPGACALSDLIQTLYRENNNTDVVVLIDEYDFPINEATYRYKDAALAYYLYNCLEGILRIMKANTRYIKIAWITGIRQFQFGSMFSGANNIKDLTYDETFATLCGFTRAEIETNFKPHIQQFAKKEGCTSQDIMNKLQDWFEGYLFNVKNWDHNKTLKVYNPSSIIECLRKNEFNSYWSNTASIDLILDEIYKDWFDNRKDPRNESTFRNYEYQISKRHILGMKYLPHYFPHLLTMLNLGYLTFEQYNSTSEIYTLKIPNHEIDYHIKNQFEEIIPFVHVKHETVATDLRYLSNAIIDYKNFSKVVDILNSVVFMNDRHTLQTVEKRGAELNRPDVTRRVYSILMYAGIGVNRTQLFSKEKNENGDGGSWVGDIDIFTTNLNINYVIEIKLDHKGKDAVKQSLDFFREHKTLLFEALNNASRLNLAMMNFKTSGINEYANAKIASWAVIPCDQSKPLLESMVYSPAAIGLYVRNHYLDKTSTYQPQQAQEAQKQTKNLAKVSNPN